MKAKSIKCITIDFSRNKSKTTAKAIHKESGVPTLATLYQNINSI